MDKNKLENIEYEYIISHIHRTNASTDYVINKSKTDEDFNACRKREIAKVKSATHTTNWLGKEDNVHGAFTCDSTVEDALLFNVIAQQGKLRVARQEADKAFKRYMNYKSIILGGGLNYGNQMVRNNLFNFKKDWIKASNNVLLAKKLLQQANLIYAKFLEWFEQVSVINQSIKEVK